MHYLRAVGRHVLHGLSFFGQWYAVGWLPILHDQPPNAGPAALPPGHPERLVPHIAPSAAERILFAQLRFEPPLRRR